MPSTLSLITNVFPPESAARRSVLGGDRGYRRRARPGERRPVVGALLLGIDLPREPADRRDRLVAGGFLLPKSSDPSHPLSTSSAPRSRSPGLFALVYAIIDGPLEGWGAGASSARSTAAVILLGAFAYWESHTDHPMLNLEFFRNPRFSAASSGLMLIFFAMFGATFLLTQYLQFVVGYSPLRAGSALLPWAAIMLVVAPLTRAGPSDSGPNSSLPRVLTRDAVARVHEHVAGHESGLRP